MDRLEIGGEIQTEDEASDRCDMEKGTNLNKPTNRSSCCGICHLEMKISNLSRIALLLLWSYLNQEFVKKRFYFC